MTINLHKWTRLVLIQIDNKLGYIFIRPIIPFRPYVVVVVEEVEVEGVDPIGADEGVELGGLTSVVDSFVLFTIRPLTRPRSSPSPSSSSAVTYPSSSLSSP